MVWFAGLFPDMIWLAIVLGAFMGFGAALLVGLVNGIGVAYFEVSPFIMTLGVSSVGAGLALFLTGGVPVSGMPFAFADTFGFGRLWGIPVPVIIALICIAVMWVFMSRTRLGTQIYAVGGNLKAAHLSAINTERTLLVAYMVCALIASLTGLLLTARVESGEANLGGTIAFESIAACVIAAAHAVLDVIEEENLCARANELAKQSNPLLATGDVPSGAMGKSAAEIPLNGLTAKRSRRTNRSTCSSSWDTRRRHRPEG